jgi:hypothetical protein
MKFVSGTRIGGGRHLGLPGRLRRLLPETVRPGDNQENTAPNLIPSAFPRLFRLPAIS